MSTYLARHDESGNLKHLPEQAREVYAARGWVDVSDREAEHVVVDPDRPEAVDLTKLSKAELTERALDAGIHAARYATKADLIALLSPAVE